MILEIKNLVKRYNDQVAVDNVSLSIQKGEIFGLLGPNGAGKTTTINTIIGLSKIDSGEVYVFGKSLKNKEMDIKKDIGIVPQEIAIYDDLTAYENVVYFAKLYNLRGSLLKERVREALEFTGIWERRKEYPKQYSGGMKRRLNIACAIAHRPKLIIMDEPTVGIDPQSRNHILESIMKLNKMGSTIIYTSHYMEEIEKICTKIAIMDHGRIIARGTKEELTNLISDDEKVKIELTSVNYTLVDNIKKIPGVKESLLDGNNLTIISNKKSNNLSRIIDNIINTGAEISALNMEKTTLEGVFLTLTGRLLRD